MTKTKFFIFTEQLITLICLMIYSGTPLDPFLTDNFSSADPDRSIYRLLYTLTYILSFLLLCLRWRKGIYALTKDKSTWLLLGVCALSIFWSSDMEASTRRIFGLVGTTIFGIYFASRYTLKEQLNICALMLSFSALACIFYGLFIPAYGIQTDVVGGALRGMYVTKNVLGKRLLLSGVLFLFLATTAQKKQWFLWMGYGASFLLILLSKSTTSLGNLILITIAFYAYRFLRLKYEIMIPTFLLVAVLSVGSSIWFDNGAQALLVTAGKDMTLTGRTDLWPPVWDMIMKRPWLGYGYGSFWLGWNSESANVLRVVGWDAPNAHSGFLDIMLSIGMLGFFIFIVGFIINMWRSIYLIRRSNNVSSIWLLIYLTFVLGSNATETTLLEQNSIEWVLYVSAVLSVKLEIDTNIFSKRLA